MLGLWSCINFHADLEQQGWEKYSELRSVNRNILSDFFICSFLLSEFVNGIGFSKEIKSDVCIY